VRGRRWRGEETAARGGRGSGRAAGRWWRGKPAARGGRGRARRARGGGGERTARRDRESEMRERRRKKNARAVYFLSLPSASDLALDKDFLKF
jgi:hypothetical protein